MATVPTIDGYLDLVRIGRGGLGDVYRAVQAETGAEVAIKVLRDVSDTSVAWHRTRRELQALLALSGHSNVIQIVELLEREPCPALVMEYAPGGSIADLMRDRGADLTVDETVFVGRQTAAALVSAHARGIIHRDIKPQNLLIDAAGHVKLCDFGIAALTTDDEYRSRTDAISTRYASPEDLEHDQHVDRPSDVYSLGATLLHLVRGAPPTLRDRVAPWSPPETTNAHLAALDRVIARCLHPTPALRPTAQQLLDSLEGLALGAGSDRVSALPVVHRDPAAIPDDDPVPDRGAASPWQRDGASGASEPGAHHDPGVDRDATTMVRPVRGLPATGPATELARPSPPGRRWHWVLLGAAAAVTATVVAVAIWSGAAEAPVITGPGATAPGSTASPATTSGIISTPPFAPQPVTSRFPSSVASFPAIAVPLTTEPRPADLAPLTSVADWVVGVVGDCLTQQAGADELVVVDCAGPHDLQRVAVGSVLDLGIADEAPFDDATVEAAVTNACANAFVGFVGSEPAASALRTAQTRPAVDTWTAGDRAFHCYVGVDGVRVVGDARSSGW